MNILTIHNVRAYLDDTGTAQINLEDAARGLGFTQTKNGTEYVRWETVEGYLQEFAFSQQAGKLSNNYIPEDIFYLLAMKANNETAKKFQLTVAKEILPSIRKHGAYMTADTLQKALASPDFLIELATKLKTEQAARIEAETKLAIAAPKAEAYTTIAEDESVLLTVGEIAKIAALPGLNETKVRECLHDLNILCKTKNEPTADAKNSGLSRIILSTIELFNRSKTIKTPKFRVRVIDLVVRHWKQKQGNLF